MSEFTDKQLCDWEEYERLRQSGQINMLDVRTGGKLTGLSKDEYIFCLKNYAELRAADEARKRGRK